MESSLKKQRGYYLSVQKANTTSSTPENMLTILSPLTVEFDIMRNYFNSDNRAMITVYNLNELTRESLFLDYFDFQAYRAIFFQAGYGDGPYPSIFSGKLSHCTSVRRGVNFVTTFEGYDPGSGINSLVPQPPLTYTEGTANAKIVSDLIGMITSPPYNLKAGSIATIPGKIAHPWVIESSIIGAIREICEYQNYLCFVDNTKINVVPNNTAIKLNPIAGQESLYRVNLITGSVNNSEKINTGLLNTPTREGGIIYFDVIFDPTIQLGQDVLLTADGGPSKYNGQYTIYSVNHKGVISNTRAGETTTTIGALYTDFTKDNPFT